jgi:hypothetical protein
MGVMALLKRIGARLIRGFEISGYTRAGNVLRSHGYNEEASKCFRMAQEIKGT